MAEHVYAAGDCRHLPLKHGGLELTRRRVSATAGERLRLEFRDHPGAALSLD